MNQAVTGIRHDCCHINKKLRSNLDIEIVYDFCMEIGPCAIGYRCPALVEIRTVQGVVRPVGTESSGRVFFSLGNWRRVITLPFHTNFHDFEGNFVPWEHYAMPSWNSMQKTTLSWDRSLTDSHNLSLFFPRPPPSLYLCPSPGILNGLSRLCHCTHSASSSLLFLRSKSSCPVLCISLSSPPAHPAVSVRMKWGLSRLCHITCFFTWTIRLRPRLSRALLLFLFSMPDKLSGCLSFRFFREKWPHSDFFSLTQIKKKKLRSMVIHR